ncbi:MAG TPA: hypothetical protein VMB81_31100 [Candidatus Sulfotelmatobacter sp.]|nr:hypothetical protein [Candidatus Sulfotelmatobacter sp.]
MSLLNESWRKLRLLFEEEEEAADAEPDAAQPAAAAAPAAAPSSAALRGEARRKRKLDMRERLAAMIQPDGSIKGGTVKFVNLFPIAAHVGDRWPILVPKVELMSEAVIRREIDPWDLWAVHGDKGFALIFTDPNLTDEEANARCLRIFEAIREHLLGQVHIGRPRFDVDPRIMLRALDEDGEPPLVMDDPQPPGAWLPPATELAARAIYVPPSGGATAARSGGAAILRSGEVAETAAPIDWQPEPERAKRDITVEQTCDRSEQDVGVDRSHDRVGGTVDLVQSHEKAAREPDWVYASVEQRKAAIAAWDGRYDAPEEFDAGRARDKRSPELVLLEGETTEQAIARYVTMGRFNTMFDAIEVRFRGFWAPRHQAVTTYFADARLRADDVDVDQRALAARADEVSALAALDIAVLARTLEAVVPRIEAGARFLFALPVAFPTLLRRADRHAYFDRWAALPEAVRKFGRFACYQSTAAIGDPALAEVVGMLSRAGRTPIFANPISTASLDRARSLRIKAIALDCGGVGDDHAFDTVRGVASVAHRYGIVTLLERVPPGVRRRVLETEASLIEGAMLRGADALPERPVVLSPEAFAAAP